MTIFRVDNPHTKAFPFWEWVIGEIKREHPEVLFLAEAFTRPKIMYRLAKLGFSQSYTYFPWRNGKYEITSYLTELTHTPVREFFRPNQWPNTPDILTEFLQMGGRAAFVVRLLLAATLGANYGIYGPPFELFENRPVRHGSEEYLDSEKYEIRHWDLDQPGTLRDVIALVNDIRNSNPALQSDWSLKFHPTDNDQLICYSKESEDRSNLIVTVVNLDPHHRQSGFVTFPLDELEIPQDRAYEAEDLLNGERYFWHGPTKLRGVESVTNFRPHPQDPPPDEDGNRLRVFPLMSGTLYFRRLGVYCDYRQRLQPPRRRGGPETQFNE